MKVLLCLGCLLSFSALAGSAVLGVLYNRQAGKLYMADKLIVGLMTVVGMAEIAHLSAVFLDRSFGDTVSLFAVETVVLGLLALGVCLWMHFGSRVRDSVGRAGGKRSSRRRNGADFTPFVAGLSLVLILLIVYQIVTISSENSVFREGDMTVETVKSFLETDGVYLVNPLTGQNYETGVPLRIQILCLPTLYGIFCHIFGLEAVELVWKLVPLLVLFMSYMAFWTLAVALFGEDKEKRMLFIMLVAAVFCVGDYMYGMDGFDLLHCGYRGVTIRGGILLPYTFGLALRHKWRPVFICVLAEACIVWSLYGMGACLLVALGMGAVRMWQKHHDRNLHEAGEGV